MGRHCCQDECERFRYHFNIDRYNASVESLTKTKIVTYEVIFKPKNPDIPTAPGERLSTEIVEEEEKYRISSDYTVKNFFYKKKKSTEYPVINGEQVIKETWEKYIVQTRLLLEFNHEDIYDWSEELYLDINLRLGHLNDRSEVGELNEDSKIIEEIIVGGIVSVTSRPRNFETWDSLFEDSSLVQSMSYLNSDGTEKKDARFLNILDVHPKENSRIFFLVKPAYDKDEFFDEFLDEQDQSDIYVMRLGLWRSNVTYGSAVNLIWLEIIRPDLNTPTERDDTTVGNWLLGYRANMMLDWHEQWRRDGTMWDFVSTRSFLNFSFDFIKAIGGVELDDTSFWTNDGQFGIKIFKPKTNNTKEGAAKTYFDAVFFANFVGYGAFAYDALSPFYWDDCDLSSGQFLYPNQLPDGFNEVHSGSTKRYRAPVCFRYGLDATGNRVCQFSSLAGPRTFNVSQLYYKEYSQNWITGIYSEPSNSFFGPFGAIVNPYSFNYVENISGDYNTGVPGTDTIFYVRNCVIEAPGRSAYTEIDAKVAGFISQITGGFFSFTALLNQYEFTEPSFDYGYYLERYSKKPYYQDVESAYISISFKNTDRFLGNPVDFSGLTGERETVFGTFDCPSYE